MFIKNLDYLSPRVTFYHKGFLSHNSIISGILSIIAILFIISLAIYYSLEIIQKKNPNAFYFNTFIEDAGIFKINASSFFHFLSTFKNNRGNFENEEFDFTTFNVIGSNIYYPNFLNVENKKGIESLNHWLYGYCNKEKNVEGYDDLVNFEFLEKSICIKKYYNSKDKKYYEIGDAKFVWPLIEHGTFHKDNQIYNLIVKKCNNTILRNILGDGYKCKTEEDIKKKTDTQGTTMFYFYFINNYINILNYHAPILKSLYRIENPLYGSQFTTNNLNFNPALVKTHDGLVLDNINEDNSYILGRNDVYTGSNQDKNIYMVYVFYLKNILDYYERIYKRIQDVISSIGGINQAITIIAIYVNSLYNNFIVLHDTENLLHSSINIEKKNDNKKKIQYEFFKKLKDLEKPKNNREKKYYSNNVNNKLYNNEKNIKKKSDKIRNEDTSCNNTSKRNYNFINKDLNPDQLKQLKDLALSIKEDRKNSLSKSFVDYFCYKITCGKHLSFFKIYENFRIKIISEEHLIRNHLNIYNLLKVTERKRNHRRNSYKLKDLINLI